MYKNKISEFSGIAFIILVMIFFLLIPINGIIPLVPSKILFYIFIVCYYFIILFFGITYYADEQNREKEYKILNSITSYVYQQLEKENWDINQIERVNDIVRDWNYLNYNKKYK